MATKEELEQIFKSVLAMKRGTFFVIPTDGDPRLIVEKPTIERIHKELSTPDRKCECLDTINLEIVGAGSRTTRNHIVMFVDDTGMLDDLPKNGLAFYIANMIKNYPHDIHGPAAIVVDEDFA